MAEFLRKNQMQPEPCETCGGAMPKPSTVGRPRRYCSAACKAKAWRSRTIAMPSVTKPIDPARQGDNLQPSRTDHPTGDTDTGPKLRLRPRQGAL